ncbi:MAG: nucleotide exchange factor GrpE [Acidimicrobiales bacterium]
MSNGRQEPSDSLGDESTGDDASTPVDEAFAVDETFTASAEDPPEAADKTGVADNTHSGTEEGAESLLGLAAERDEYLNSLRRLQADFDNYRKRTVRQQTELLERASEGLLIQLLPVLDALDLAQAHSEGESVADDGAVSQIATLLRETLKRQGLERIDAVGVAFDPTVHDAVAHEEADANDGGADLGDAAALGAAESPRIAEVMRAGYRLKGRVVRPAMVKVKG